MLELQREKIWLTGAFGFLGQHVYRELLARGCYESQILRTKRTLIDLRNQHVVRGYLSEKRPGVVIHLAANVGGIGANQANPGAFAYDNLIMGTNILEESRREGVKKVVLVGTCCSYPCHTPVPFKESDLWNGYPEPTNAPYGVAKRALLSLAMAYRQQYGFNAVCPILANLYGEFDDFDLAASHVIPALIRKAVEAKSRGDDYIDVWGTGEPSRELLYAGEAAKAVVDCAERLETSDPVNIGTGQEVKIRDLVDMVCKTVGFTGSIRWNHDKPDGQPRRSLDTTRAKELLNWEATTPLEEGLKRTVDWYVASMEPCSN